MHFLQKTPFKCEYGGSDGKESACNAGDLVSIPGSRRSPEERNHLHSSMFQLVQFREQNRSTNLGKQSQKFLSNADLLVGEYQRLLPALPQHQGSGQGLWYSQWQKWCHSSIIIMIVIFIHVVVVAFIHSISMLDNIPLYACGTIYLSSSLLIST